MAIDINKQLIELTLHEINVVRRAVRFYQVNFELLYPEGFKSLGLESELADLNDLMEIIK